MASHSITTKMPKNSSDEPRSFSTNRIASETPHATARGARWRGSGSLTGPIRRVAIASSSFFAFR